MLRAIEPQTEADPAGLLACWLACFGNVVGRGAWMQIGPRKHYPALYVGMVGRSSDAKGDTWAASIWPFKQADPSWASLCIANGYSGPRKLDHSISYRVGQERGRDGTAAEELFGGVQGPGRAGRDPGRLHRQRAGGQARPAPDAHQQLEEGPARGGRVPLRRGRQARRGRRPARPRRALRADRPAEDGPRVAENKTPRRLRSRAA